MNVTFYDANSHLRRTRGERFGRVLARFVAGGREHDPVVVEIAHTTRNHGNVLRAEVLNPEEFPEGVSEAFMEAAKRYYARTLAAEGTRVRGYEKEPAAQPGTAWSVYVPDRENR